MYYLEMNHIKKHFDDLEVLKDISLKVEEGQVVAIIGPSGSGKSTLLRCATMLERMDDGELIYLGEKAAWSENGASLYEKPGKLRELKRYYGLVFQNFNLFPHCSVMKNICDAPVRVQKRDKKEVTEQARMLLKKMGLADKENAYPYQLSGGQQQRVSIARALAGNPSVILADEPTGALDSKTSREVIDFLIQLNEGGNTIVLITHDNFIAARAKRVIRIQDGKVIYDGPAQGDEIIRAQCFRQEEEGSREAH